MTIQVTGDSGEDTGSGWVFDDQGHIVTNNHVVEAAATGGKIVSSSPAASRSRRPSSAGTCPTTWLS